MYLKIREQRRLKNMSLRTLAQKSAIPKSTLSKIENNQKDIRLSELIKISKALDVKFITLIYED